MLQKGFLCLIVIGITISEAIAQTTATDDFSTSAVQQFQRFSRLPAEKLYLHLDKPYYSAGENIWYSAYLTDAMYLQPSPYSRFIYVELINKSDSVKFRYKIRRDSLGFVGAVPLPADLPAGDYHLRAYTWWMQNGGTDYFFQHSLHIGNAIDRSIQSHATYEQSGNKQVIANIQFTSSENISFAGKRVRYQLFEGNKLVRSRSASIDGSGKLRLGVDYDPDNDSQYRIELSFDDNTYNYRNIYYLPQSNNTFDIQFFPEGGTLLDGNFCNVAFKAVGQNGLSVEVTGVVCNQRGDSITSFASEHKGMGKFGLYADKAEGNYYAKVFVQGSSSVKTVLLPPVAATGIDLTMIQLNKELRYQVASTSTQKNVPLYLLAHQRGRLMMIVPVADSAHWEGTIGIEPFSTGIVHFLLLNAQGDALSERLIFIRKATESHLSITPDATSCQPRQKVNLTIGIDGTDSLQGKFSLAVTEDQSVKMDSLADNIYSNLLLTSDLKGYIEDPNYYFCHPDKYTDHALDLVMLTHGWTRFNVPNILHGKMPAMPFFLEEGQSLSGTVKNIIGKPAKGAQIIALGSNNTFIKTVTANEQGNYIIDGISFPDSTTILLQSRSKHGYRTVDIIPDKEQYPAVESLTPFSETKINSSFMDDYLKTMELKFHYEGGERVFHLKEVTVTASSKDNDNRGSIYDGLGNPVRSDEIEKRFSGQTVLDIVRTFPGVQIMADRISVRGSHADPSIIVDEMPYDVDDVVEFLGEMNVNEVESVNLLRGADAAIAGVRGAGGVIVIQLKKGANLSSSAATPGLVVLRPLGYYRPAQFYSPVYETSAQINNPNPDLRTTIYWNPSLIVDKEHPSKLSFYTADRPGSYTVTVEGITNTGEPIHQEAKVYVSGKE